MLHQSTSNYTTHVLQYHVRIPNSIIFRFQVQILHFDSPTTLHRKKSLPQYQQPAVQNLLPSHHSRPTNPPLTSIHILKHAPQPNPLHTIHPPPNTYFFTKYHLAARRVVVQQQFPSPSSRIIHPNHPSPILLSNIGTRRLPPSKP